MMLVVAAAAGCGGDQKGGADQGGGAPTTSGRTTTAPTTVEERCKVPVAGSLTEFPGPGGSVLTGAVLGTGPDVAVLLHQTSPAGFCGFAPYAEWLAGQGVRAVLVDLCGWGKARCQGAFAGDLGAQVKLPVDWARAHGATRITVVGASMGGALALGFAQPSGADALVDLSGPVVWSGTPGAGEAAAATTIPLLAAMAPGDRDGIGMDPTALAAAVASSPAKHKRFVSTDGGHGWVMLGDNAATDARWYPLATTVLQWVRGEYAAS